VTAHAVKGVDCTQSRVYILYRFIAYLLAEDLISSMDSSKKRFVAIS
ncbi:hypothetical protein L195_g061070, partial [Trifolium pratense]